MVDQIFLEILNRLHLDHPLAQHLNLKRLVHLVGDHLVADLEQHHLVVLVLHQAVAPLVPALLVAVVPLLHLVVVLVVAPLEDLLSDLTPVPAMVGAVDLALLVKSLDHPLVVMLADQVVLADSVVHRPVDLVLKLIKAAVVALEALVAHQAANHKVAQALPDQHFLDSEAESNILVKFCSIKHSPKN